MNRIKDKIEEIEEYVEELKPALPSSFEEYEKDYKIRAICERYFEKIIEAVTDLAFLIIKKKSYKTPENDKEAFDILINE